MGDEGVISAIYSTCSKHKKRAATLPKPAGPHMHSHSNQHPETTAANSPRNSRTHVRASRVLGGRIHLGSHWKAARAASGRLVFSCTDGAGALVRWLMSMMGDAVGYLVVT